jgi:hypothetical protein
VGLVPLKDHALARRTKGTSYFSACIGLRWPRQSPHATHRTRLESRLLLPRLNRGNARRTVFHKDGDYAAFVKLLAQAGERTDVRLVAFCVMPEKKKGSGVFLSKNSRFL